MRFVWVSCAVLCLVFFLLGYTLRVDDATAQKFRTRHLHLPDLNRFQHEYFPQAMTCGSWQDTYARLHNEIRNGKKPPRYFVSVAVEAGIADRLSGMITQLYLAILSSRVFTAITYGDLPAFESACSSPYINWTDPNHLQDDVIGPLKYTYKGLRGYRGDRSYPKSVNTAMFSQLYTINSVPDWRNVSLSRIPKDRPETPS